MQIRPQLRSPQVTMLLLATILLAGCAGEGGQMLRYTPVDYSALSGWGADDLAGAGAALRHSCAKLTAPAWQAACAALPADDNALRPYFEAYFSPYRLETAPESAGLFTGYYAPELAASRTRQGDYQTPIYGLPTDLAVADLGAFKPSLQGQRLTGRVEQGRFVPYPSRATITQQGVPAPILAWAADPVAVFILQVQGSGRLRFPDGTTQEVGYAGQNGHPYVAIGKVLRTQGAFPEGKVTMPRIVAWLAAHPARRDDILNSNPSYVFFRPQAGAAQGALGVPLTPERSLAVDPRYVPLGAPVWLETRHPQSGAPWQRLLLAQDTGGAIKGALRGDVYWGYGGQAAANAGVMQSPGGLTLLLPKALPPPAERVVDEP